MPTITVGLDGSPHSLAAAYWAARAAEQRDASLHLVHAWEQHPYVRAPFIGLSAPAAIDAQREWAAYTLRDAQSRIAKDHPDLPISTHQAGEQAVPALLSAAGDADMLVLGSRGIGGVAGFLAGSVALAVVARSPGPVVLVRAVQRAEDEHLPDASGSPSTVTPYRDVVLGLDPESTGDAVIGFAFDAAQRQAAGLRVVHGWTLPTAYGYGAAMDFVLNDELSEQVWHRMTEVLRPWKAKYPGVEVREHAVVGGSGRHLVHASRDAALVVVGRKNRRAPVGAHIGAVTHAVLQHASAPVAVVPHD
ncbi:universal stress protein [Streptomyces sp. NK08204]|uniref:universal stress protein n=1 Tax=Streptomyces sp. NK08204 TaxID=2873260 RepID=UPI001CED8B7F|nr:universal stress protein [Streptomyces sp. NK08204]